MDQFWRHGRSAGILFVFPSMPVLLALSIIYVSFGNLPWNYAMFNGLKPAVIAIIIIVVAFVGFMSGYNHFHGSIGMGTIALVVTTFYTFLPFFSLLGADLFSADAEIQAQRGLPDPVEHFIRTVALFHKLVI